jgi:hypothetical protein
MARAAEDDAAREKVLSTVARRRVVVATWPHSPESVRTLTNSEGEQAMPLFTGVDALNAAAQRFGWTGADGSVSHRELDGLDALRGAVANAVHFVVLDICAEDSVEFSRDEIEASLSSATQEVIAEAQAQARPTAAGGEVDSPFGRERTTGLTAIAAIEQSVAARPGRGTRPDPRAEPSIATPLGAVAVARVAVPIGSRAATMRRPERLTTPLAMEAVQPAARTATPAAFPAVQPEQGRAARPPSPLPFEAVMPTHPAAANAAPPIELPAGSTPNVAHVELPSLDATDGFPMAEPAQDAGFGFGLASEEPEAKPAALEAAVMMQQIGKMAGDAATQQAAAEVATMLKQMAMKGGVDEDKPDPAKSAAKALAAMLAGSATAAQPAAAVVAAHAAAHAAEPPPPPPEAARKAKRAKPKVEARGSSTAVPKVTDIAEPAADCVLGPLETPLGDALLDAIAEGLRKYPEVEWACEVSDGTDVAVIGVRVAPGFTTNVPQIKQLIARAGEGHGARLSVLLLADPQQMKEARSQGSVFFPWRKGGKR